MATQIREVDEAFLFSPEVQGLLERTTSWTFDTMTEAERAGLTRGVDYNTYTVTVTYLEKDYWLPLIVDVKVQGEQVHIRPMGIRTQTLIDTSITEAFGYKLESSTLGQFLTSLANNEYTKPFVKWVDNATDQLLVDCYITKDGKRYLYNKFMTNAYSVLYNMFGAEETGTPSECNLSFKQSQLVEGQSTLISGDNVNVTNIAGTILYNNPITGIDYLTAVADLEDIIATNPAVYNALNKTAVRIGRKQDGALYIWGYDVLNNDVVTTNETGSNQHYSITITHYYKCSFAVENGHLVLDGTYDAAVNNHSETFYNYSRSTDGSWLIGIRITNGFMSTTEAKASFLSVAENVGVSSRSKGGEVTGITPTSAPMTETYPDWPQNEDDDWPVGDPDPDEDPQPTIWVGVPTTPQPIPQLPGLPLDRIDDIGSDSTVPDVDGVQATYGLFTVYKCTFSNLVSLGNFLWQENTITALKNIWANDPMSAIISLHQIYKTPDTTRDKEIRLGMLNTGITALEIEDRYQTVLCGSIVVGEYFNDVRDYQTEMSIYLPFIGIHQLDIAEFIGGRISVQYTVDIFTGDCVATIAVQRGTTHSKVLYTFNGNCASPLPLSAADKSRLFANIANTVVGTVKGLVAGGAIAGPMGAAMGAGNALVSGALNTALTHNIDIQKSGSLSGNFGAMGYKKPYLIYGRPQPYDAVDRETLEGFPVNMTVSLSSLSGFTRVKYVHVDNIPGATDTEKQMIEAALKEGVII